jgi:hypothetical protein
MRIALKFSHPEMNLFTASGRESSFTKYWQDTCVLSPAELAAAGLFKCPFGAITVKCNDAVICSYCDICIGNWEVGDTGIGEHKRWSPNCPFISRFPNGTTDPAERDLICTTPKCCC